MNGDPATDAIVTPTVASEAIRLWTAGRLLAIPGAGHCIHRDRWTASMEPIRAYLLQHVDSGAT